MPAVIRRLDLDVYVKADQKRVGFNEGTRIVDGRTWYLGRWAGIYLRCIQDVGALVQLFLGK